VVDIALIYYAYEECIALTLWFYLFRQDLVFVDASIVSFAASKAIPLLLEIFTGLRKDYESQEVTAQMEEVGSSPVCTSPIDIAGCISETRTDAIICSA
jgi:hypothetical protein